MAVKYYTTPAGSFITQDAATPSLPPGAVEVTKAQYDTALAAARASADSAFAVTQTAELMAYHLTQSQGFRTVASSQAPQRIKDTAAYVCDGTADDVQINNAIADCIAEGGGTVFLSVGEFFLTDSVSIPVTQSLVIQGSGWDTSLKNATNTNRYAVKFVGGGDTRVVIRDLTVDGNRAAQTTGGGCIWADGAVQCRFINLHVTAFRNEGLHLGPIGPGAFGHNNVVRDCLFDQSIGSPGEGHGVHMTSSDENMIVNCDFEYLGGTAGQAAGILDESGTQFIQGCNFVNGIAGKPAVRVKDCHNTRVQGCNFDGVGGTGVIASGTGHTIGGNTFSNVGINTGTGTYVAGTISGVNLEFAARNNIVANNVMKTNAVNGAAHSLVREPGDGGAGNNLIVGNTFMLAGTAAQGVLDLHGPGTAVRSNMGPTGVITDTVVP